MTVSAPIIAVYDANVLYPASLRDFLIRLARSGLVGARWSYRIHDEWIRNLLVNRPDLTAEQLERTRRLMDAAVPGAVVDGFERHLPELDLPDPDDRHVLAAAIEAKAHVFVIPIPMVSCALTGQQFHAEAQRGTKRTQRPAAGLCELSVFLCASA